MKLQQSEIDTRHIVYVECSELEPLFFSIHPPEDKNEKRTNMIGKSPVFTGWFRLNAQNCVPGNSSRHFFELDHEILHTYSGRQYLKLEEGGVLIWGFAVEISGFDPPPGSSTPAGTPNNRPPRQKIKKKTSSSFRW